MRPVRVASCDHCGAHGPMSCKYTRHDAALDLWPESVFCDGKCCAEWLRQRNHLPNPGIVTALGNT